MRKLKQLQVTVYLLILLQVGSLISLYLVYEKASLIDYVSNGGTISLTCEGDEYSQRTCSGSYSGS